MSVAAVEIAGTASDTAADCVAAVTRLGNDVYLILGGLVGKRRLSANSTWLAAATSRPSGLLDVDSNPISMLFEEIYKIRAIN